MITPILIESENLYLNPLHARVVKKTLEGNEFKEEMVLNEEKIHVTYKKDWPGDALKLFPSFIRNFDEEILGTMTIILKENNEAIGVIGVKYESPDLNDLRKVEFGYNIIKDYEGRGIATEALKAFINYLTEYSEFNSALAYVEDGNVASKIVLEKNNFKEVESNKQNHKAFITSVKK